MKIVGQIPRNGNHLKDRSFRSVPWLSITPSLRRTSQESITLERKSYLDCSSDTLCTRVCTLEGWRTGCRPWGVGNDGRIWNLLKKDSMRKRWYFPKKMDVFKSQMDESKTPGEEQELRTSTLIRPRPSRGEGHIDFLGESEGSLPRPHDSFPDAGEAINDFWSMSGSFIYRHHVESRVKLYSPREESFSIPLKIHWRIQELLERIWMLCKNAASKTFGISMGQDICLIHGQVSHNLLYWKKNLQTDICGQVRD